MVPFCLLQSHMKGQQEELANVLPRDDDFCEGTIEVKTLSSIKKPIKKTYKKKPIKKKPIKKTYKKNL
jgi:hypothetical protein